MTLYDSLGANNFGIVNAIIASGAAISNAIKTAGLNITGLYIPSAWTAAAITFQASPDGATYYPVYGLDSTGAIVETTLPSAGIPTAAVRFIQIPAGTFDGAGYVIINSGTNAAPVNQGAQRTLPVAVRYYGPQ